MTAPNLKSDKNMAFQLKGSLFTLTVLHLLSTDTAAFAEQLTKLVKQTPKFFHYMPIVLDLQKVSSQTINFSNLINCLREHNIIPVGVRGGTPEQHEAAMNISLAILPNTKPEPIERNPANQISTKPTKPVATQPQQGSKLITQPIRSGQQIYARNADLIVLAPVSRGAELLADGNIHVYGPLRGRALAGVTGNQDARIFCQNLDAELVSIAGHYWVSEDLQKNSLKDNVHIYLENERLHVGTL